MLNAILIGVADHGSRAPSCAAARLVASGNRQSLSAAVAAGVLAIGDEHGGAGSLCMEMIAADTEKMAKESLSAKEAAAKVFEEYRSSGRRLPGFGHRVHAAAAFLFNLAEQYKLAGHGIRLLRELEVLIGEKVKPLPINIDGALAGVLHDLGFRLPSANLFLLWDGWRAYRPRCKKSTNAKKPCASEFQSSMTAFRRVSFERESVGIYPAQCREKKYRSINIEIVR